MLTKGGLTCQFGNGHKCIFWKQINKYIASLFLSNFHDMIPKGILPKQEWETNK